MLLSVDQGNICVFIKIMVRLNFESIYLQIQIKFLPFFLFFLPFLLYFNIGCYLVELQKEEKWGKY
jgi:hypothetical protein